MLVGQKHTSDEKICSPVKRRKLSVSLETKEAEEDILEDKKDQTVANILVVENEMDEVEKEQSLFNAAETGDYESIAKLLSLGVSVEAKNLNLKLHYSFTHLLKPLQIATSNGHVKCVQMLIDCGANVDAEDEFRCTALHLAAEAGNYPCLKILLEAGASCSVPIVERSSYLTNAPYIGGTTPLHLATKYNHVNCVKELINFGADYNAVDKNGHTSLYIAAKEGFSECVLTHLKNACGRAILSLPCYETSNTPLHFAVLNRMPQCVKQLISVGADVNHINKCGYSPLHLLCDGSGANNVGKKVELDLLRSLVLDGCNTDINIISSRFLTPLHYAVFMNYDAEKIALLIAYGANINIKHRNKKLTFLEYELKYRRNHHVLKCLVQCMPRVPHLKSLNVCSISGEHHEEDFCEEDAIWHGSVLPSNVYIRLVQDESDIYIEMQDREADLLQFTQRRNFIQRRIKCRYLLRQPLLNLVFERVVDEIKQLDCCLKKDVNLRYSTGQTPKGYKNELMMLRKLLWYEKIASNPPTLQQHCRFSIRNHLGYLNLKHIRKLPLPRKLRSFLLFECDK